MPSRQKKDRNRKGRYVALARMRVRCSGKLHNIVLTGHGKLALCDHPDPHADEVMEAMTGVTCRCRLILYTWQRYIERGTLEQRRHDEKDVLDKLPRPLKEYAEQARDRHQTHKEARTQASKAARREYEQTSRVPRHRLFRRGREAWLAAAKTHKNYDKDQNWFDDNKYYAELKNFIASRLAAESETRAQAILDRCTYRMPEHILPRYMEPSITVRGYWARRTFIHSCDESIDRQSAEWDEYGVQRRLCIGQTDPISLARAYILTGGTAHDGNGTRVAVIGIERPKPHIASEWQEVATAGWQNPKTSVIRTRRCLIRRGEAGWEVVEWLADETAKRTS